MVCDATVNEYNMGTLPNTPCVHLITQIPFSALITQTTPSMFKTIVKAMAQTIMGLYINYPDRILNVIARNTLSLIAEVPYPPNLTLNMLPTKTRLTTVPRPPNLNTRVPRLAP